MLVCHQGEILHDEPREYGGGGRTFPLDRSIGGLARTITARYYKTGAANILEHWEDGYSDTGIIEIEDSAGDEEGIH